jgi:hypothetical protein
VVNLKKQTQFVTDSEPVQAIPKACGFEAATRLLWLRDRFEKTKPICRQTGAKPYTKGVYGEFCHLLFM